MSKHKHKRRSTPRSPVPHRERARTPKPARSDIPSAPTVFRFTILDEQASKLVDKAFATLGPQFQLRDAKVIERIKLAQTPEEVLSIAPAAHGLAESAWLEHVRQFGPAIVPLIAQQLRASQNISNEKDRDIVRERLIAALRWQGELGAKALVECIDSLDEYTQSLTCVALGVSHAEFAADLVYKTFQKLVSLPKTYFVGALWGLVDLQDKRAADALIQLLEAERDFHELYGFLSLAGDARAIIPLVARMLGGLEDDKEQSSMALVSVAQRIGREALLAEFEKMSAADVRRESLEATADRFLGHPISDVQEYFQLFYRGLTDKDML